MSYLYLTILFPLIGFVLLAAGRNKLPENVAAIIGVGSVGLSALFALIAGMGFVDNGSVAQVQHLWTWFNVGGFAPGMSLHLDGLSLLMTGMITGVEPLLLQGGEVFLKELLLIPQSRQKRNSYLTKKYFASGW